MLRLNPFGLSAYRPIEIDCGLWALCAIVASLIIAEGGKNVSWDPGYVRFILIYIYNIYNIHNIYNIYNIYIYNIYIYIYIYMYIYVKCIYYRITAYRAAEILSSLHKYVTISDKICKVSTLTNLILTWCFHSHGLWLNKSNHPVKQVDISKLTDINILISINGFYPIQVLIFTR